jgi:RNA polymerase sigma factor (TIGR02999 family)
MSDVTHLLIASTEGDPSAADKLLPLVYDELRKLAASNLAREQAGQTLQATALVHEAWLRLGGADPSVNWQGRRHFFGAAAEAMRRILVERARRRDRIRHGGKLERVDLQHVTIATEDTEETVLAIHDALEKLAAQDSQKAEIVKLRYFTGMNHNEIAQTLGLSEVTVRRHWAYARSWLFAELKDTADK